MPKISHIIIEGVDRLGKNTLIDNIQNKMGFYQVLHYQKPQLLSWYVDSCNGDKKDALKSYQYLSFDAMFSMMNSKFPRILCNRGHLGETVYAKRYRGYNGDYVFDIEKTHISTLDSILLVLLTTSDFSFIEDDGQSFDVSAREEEQKDFIQAFNTSIIPNKLMIDVCYNGVFKSSDEISKEVLAKL